MRSLVQVDGRGLRMALCVCLTASLGACAHDETGEPSQVPRRKPRPNKRPNENGRVNHPRSYKPVPTAAVLNNAWSISTMRARWNISIPRPDQRWHTGRAESDSAPCRCVIRRNIATAGPIASAVPKHDVNVDTIGLTHFHLSMETGIECYTLPDPGDGLGRGFGKLVDFKCTDVDWAKTPRVLSSHDQNQWVKVWVSNPENRAPTYFDMESISVLPDTSIQLWFRKRDGTWWFWPELKAGKHLEYP